MKKIVIRLTNLLVPILFLTPLIFTFYASLLSPDQVSRLHTYKLPYYLSPYQYFDLIFVKNEYFSLFLNSVKITFWVILGQLVISVLAAYGLAKIKTKYAIIVVSIYVFALLLPQQLMIIPNMIAYDLLYRLTSIKLLDSHMAIILPGVFSTLGVIYIRYVIMTLPDEIIEAARIDGASELVIIVRIVVPNIKGALFAMIALVFLEYWNVIEQGVVFLDSLSKFPVSVYLKHMHDTDINAYFASAVIYCLPIIVAFGASRKKLRRSRKEMVDMKKLLKAGEYDE